MATHSSILAWGIPWTEPGRLQPTGSHRVGDDSTSEQQWQCPLQALCCYCFKGHAFHEEPCKSEMPARCCYSLSVASSQNLSLEL